MKITLERYQESGWEFTITATNPYTDKTTTTRYRTNPAGDGLWIYQTSHTQWYADGSDYMEWHQNKGTSQFRLPVEHKRAYDRIRYEWGRPV